MLQLLFFRLVFHGRRGGGHAPVAALHGNRTSVLGGADRGPQGVITTGQSRYPNPQRYSTYTVHTGSRDIVETKWSSS